MHITILQKSQNRKFSKSNLKIQILELDILILNIPLKKRIKKKYDVIIQNAFKSGYVISADIFLNEYILNNGLKSWLYYELNAVLDYYDCFSKSETISVIIKKNDRIFAEVIKKLSKRYKVIEIYTPSTVEIQNSVEKNLIELGVPVLFREYSEGNKLNCEKALLIEDNLSIIDFLHGIEVKDMYIEFLYPVNQYANLPLEKILKVYMENNPDISLIEKKIIKFVGEMSK